MKRVRTCEDELKLSITPLIDVTFLLLIFFMCAMKFKTLEQKVEAWLPKHKGVKPVPPEPPKVVPVDIKLVRDAENAPTRVLLFGESLGIGEDGFRRLDEKIMRIMSLRSDDPPPAEIDAGPKVPHSEVMRGLDSLMLGGVEVVTFRGVEWPEEIAPR